MKLVPILLLLISINLAAQDNGCTAGSNSGGLNSITRYQNEIFGTVKMTTVQYGRNASVFGDTVNLFMDIYEPEGDKATQRPVIVLAFGGAFITGDRTQLAEFAKAYARQGYVAACIDYRIWPLFILGFPDSSGVIDVAMKAISDMKASIRYLRSEASKYKIDTNRIIGGGVSAGAITAIHTAYMDPNDSIPPYLKSAITKNGGFTGNTNNATLKHSSKLMAVMNLSGGIFDPQWIDKEEAPLYSIHGTADGTVPFGVGKAAGLVTLQGSGAIHDYLTQNNISNSLIKVPNGGHTNIYLEVAFKSYVDSFFTSVGKNFYTMICGNIISASDDKKISYSLAKIYPNPAIYYTYIDTHEKITSVKMYDMAGRSVNVKLDQNRIDWSDRLASGIYALEINLRNNTRLYSKILVQ